jgi:intracellular multiplication protein IcmL
MKNEAYGAVEGTLTRFEVYRRAFHLMGYAAIGMSGVTLLAVATAWWALASKPEPRYFIASEDGGVIPIVSVDQPYLNDAAVLNFAVEAITNSLTLNFANWRAQLSASSEFFERPSGWNNWLEALEGSGTLELIRNRNLVSSVVANGAVIVNRGPDAAGRFRWVVQVPITINYQSSSERRSENRVAELEIARLPTWQTSRAVGVTRVLIR